MKKLKLIYNPYAGDKTFMYSLDSCIQVFQQCGYEVHVFRSMEAGDVERHIEEMGSGYEALVVSGGDGTIGQAVNAMMTHNQHIPLGIIPSGTANDFGTYLKMPKDHQKAAEAIAYGKRIPVDVGLVARCQRCSPIKPDLVVRNAAPDDSHMQASSVVGNLPGQDSRVTGEQRYFINVCGAGLLTNISQNIDVNFKDTLGKLAYYLEGIGQIPNFVPMPVRITTNSHIIEDNVYFFIVLNSAGTGGFERLSPNPSISDGLFDFIAFKAKSVMQLAVLSMKVLAGDYLDDSNIIFCRDSYFKIENLAEEDNSTFNETDIDGERGPDMPIEIRNISRAIEVFAPAWETW